MTEQNKVEVVDLSVIRNNLKQGDYDGVDIMRAYLAIDELLALRNPNTTTIPTSEYEKLKLDAELLDWLSDPSQNIGNVHLPTECVEKNVHSLRDAIRCAIDQAKKL